MFIYNTSLQAAQHLCLQKLCLQFLISLVVRVISASYIKFKKLNVCDLNPIYDDNLFIGLRSTCDIQSDTTVVSSDIRHEKFLYSKII